MEALRFSGSGKKLELVDIPVPRITDPDQVLIKVAFAGICGTDLHIIAGEFPCSAQTVTLGHEFSGTVVDVGSDVVNVKKGDRVSVDPNDGCRCCDHCHNGHPHYCKVGGIQNTIGIYRNGGWATYAVIPAHTVTKLPDSLTLEQGALTEPMSCLSHGWDLLVPVPVGARILVMGAGIIGNLWVSVLHLQGHKKVTVSEPTPSRLKITERLDTGYDLITPDQLKKNQQADPDYLFDVIIDCSGFCPAIEHAISLLDMGGRLCCFGVAPPHGRISVSPYQLYAKEAKIFAINVNPYSFVKAVGFMEAMGSRYLDYEKLGIKVFKLQDYQEAMELLKKGTIAKAVFRL
ncbi:uncharacterized protein LOC132706296 [Cylas formicarius]|uniref:uncharacterized protein LOC132706296 n=1 Tax=Cylas formicarius TaxID=197179 RepID=UPI0029585956|nr:uncharacterized protein LOC132706296 [Cylas formicarius]